jgi:hypothetical protein
MAGPRERDAPGNGRREPAVPAVGGPEVLRAIDVTSGANGRFAGKRCVCWAASQTTLAATTTAGSNTDPYDRTDIGRSFVTCVIPYQPGAPARGVHAKSICSRPIDRAFPQR